MWQSLRAAAATATRWHLPSARSPSQDDLGAGSCCRAPLAASHSALRRQGEPCLAIGPPPPSDLPDWLADESSPAQPTRAEALRSRDMPPTSATICAPAA